MSEVTYYVALPSVLSDDGVAAAEAVECFNPNSAVMKAEALSRKPGYVGAVAFSRSGDPGTGVFGDAKEVRRRARGLGRAVKLDWVRNEIARMGSTVPCWTAIIKKWPEETSTQ